MKLSTYHYYSAHTGLDASSTLERESNKRSSLKRGAYIRLPVAGNENKLMSFS
jgi:hypothetical protein